MKGIIFQLTLMFFVLKKCQNGEYHTEGYLITPIIAEYPFDGIPFASTNREISFRNSVNFTITKPNPIKAMLVLIQDKNVLSLARCSLDLSKAFFSFDSFMLVRFKFYCKCIIWAINYIIRILYEPIFMLL
jgi:hypothetical protein